MIRNLRDIGGVSCEGGRRLKKNLIFRSALLSDVNEEDRKWIKDKNIKYIYDLRSSLEASFHPDALFEGVIQVNHYLQDANHDAFSYHGMLQSIQNAESEEEQLTYIPSMEIIYITMVENDFCRERFAQLIRNIMNSDDGSVLYHCTSGKDRTGMTTAVLLAILGAGRADIMKEYLLTRAHARWEYLFRKDEYVKEGYSEAVSAKLAEFYTIKPSFLEAFFSAAESRRGSLDAFIRQDLHISDGAIESFKKRVLEKE